MEGQWSLQLVASCRCMHDEGQLDGCQSHKLGVGRQEGRQALREVIKLPCMDDQLQGHNQRRADKKAKGMWCSEGAMGM